MKWYNPSTDEMEDTAYLFLLYYKFKKRKFYFKVWLLKKIIRNFGFGVMHEIMGMEEVNAYTMFHGNYAFRKGEDCRRRGPLV